MLDSHGRLVITSLAGRGGQQDRPGRRRGHRIRRHRPAGGSPVPWLALTGLGVALTVGGIARLRTLRWARRAAAHVR